MAGTKVQPTTEGGGRKMSDAARAKLSATNRARFAAMTDEQRAAQLANLGRKPKAPAGPPPTKDPPPSTGGRPNPLHDAPGAGPGDRPQPQGPLGAPPRFVVPDLPPLDLGGDDETLDDGALAGDVVTDGLGVTDVQVGEWLSLPFDLIAERRGDHWRLRPGERDRLAAPLARKINEHAVVARTLNVGGDWALIVGGFVLIINARLAEDARHDRTDSPGGGSSPSRGSAPPARGHRGDAVRRGAGAARGSLNGVPSPDDAGEAHDAGDQAVDPEPAERPLVQAL